MPPVPQTIAELHRQHYRDVLAPLIRILGSFEAAEDVTQEAFAKALDRWPEEGVPAKPLAWLRRVARNAAIDRYRRGVRWQENAQMLRHEPVEEPHGPDPDVLRDDTLRLLFTCCHPALSREAQIALTLHTVCGLTTDQIARSFLAKRTTLQQRLVRAKRKIDTARIPYVVPDRTQLSERLSSALKTIYLVFNEGYGASDGEALLRLDLCDEAIRLGRLVVDLLPEEREAKGLLALMLLQHSRRDARTDDAGDLVTLEHQDRSRWDRGQIAEALPLVEAALPGGSLYAIEAAVAALHARASIPEDTDWPQIAALYAVLLRRSGHNPVVALNAAVAVAMAGNLPEGLRRLDALTEQGALSGYHLLPAARGHLLQRMERTEAARQAFAEALDLVTNPVERRFLEKHLQKIHGGVDPASRPSSGK